MLYCVGPYTHIILVCVRMMRFSVIKKQQKRYSNPVTGLDRL